MPPSMDCAVAGPDRPTLRRPPSLVSRKGCLWMVMMRVLVWIRIHLSVVRRLKEVARRVSIRVVIVGMVWRRRVVPRRRALVVRIGHRASANWAMDVASPVGVLLLFIVLPPSSHPLLPARGPVRQLWIPFRLLLQRALSRRGRSLRRRLCSSVAGVCAPGACRTVCLSLGSSRVGQPRTPDWLMYLGCIRLQFFGLLLVVQERFRSN
mmetsp:Transcript_6954/g.25616  ORF Transcript_6954/g.25616 Transcript_6954/m.25616 type:complete len:208 (-) Transcript_6954:340-963(-)